MAETVNPPNRTGKKFDTLKEAYIYRVKTFADLIIQRNDELWDTGYSKMKEINPTFYSISSQFRDNALKYVVDNKNEFFTSLSELSQDELKVLDDWLSGAYSSLEGKGLVDSVDSLVTSKTGLTLAQNVVDKSVGRYFNPTGIDGHSASCALTVLIKALLNEWKSVTGKTPSVKQVDSIIDGLHKAGMLNSIPSLVGYSTAKFLQIGWNALGQKGYWAGGPWLTEPSKAKQSALYPNVYTIYKVPTKYSKLGGVHYILQMPGQSDFYDPRTGDMIKSYSDVAGYDYKRPKDVIIYPIAF